MRVVATWEFEPDTSEIEVNKQGFALEFAKRELAYMIDNGISTEDFEFTVIDDGDDHPIPDDGDEHPIP